MCFTKKCPAEYFIWIFAVLALFEQCSNGLVPFHYLVIRQLAANSLIPFAYLCYRYNKLKIHQYINQTVDFTFASGELTPYFMRYTCPGKVEAEPKIKSISMKH